MTWRNFENGETVGKLGSENGTILRDDEHTEGSRITLEQGGHVAPFAITCGIYGWMFHTRFFGSETDAQSEFEAMKEALVCILESIPLSTDSDAGSKAQKTSQLIADFVERFP
jgi:hypothetical protein